MHEIATLLHSRLIFYVIVPSLATIALCLIIERVRPAGGVSFRQLVLNINYSVLRTFLIGATDPIGAAVIGLTVAWAGGGLIVLPSSGWGLLLGVAAYLLAMDCAEYAFHRAQHRIPALWAMHSLHHSDPAMNVSTTLRHFWAENLIKAGSVYLVVALVLRVNPMVSGLYTLIAMSNFFFHMNLRVGFGRFSFIFNSPQYHRIHHSLELAHRDRNFAAILPIFDVMFGGYYRPHPGEYPRTGLYDADQPSGLVEAVLWPARGLVRRRGQKPRARDASGIDAAGAAEQGREPQPQLAAES
jgi:sterol desaturase/sphingolipid hydroxylase (fatty acid hydroxylase superfamily)